MATAELCSQVGLFATALLPQKQTLSAGRRPSDNKSYCGLLGSQTLKGRRKRSEGIGVEKEVEVKSVSEGTDFSKETTQTFLLLYFLSTD
jgi:hypothetical protein